MSRFAFPHSPGAAVLAAPLLAPLLLALAGAEGPPSVAVDWEGAADRVWAGPDLWANRLQDWRVRGGRLECVEDRPGKPRRTVVHTGVRLTGPGAFAAAVTVAPAVGLRPEGPGNTGTAARRTAADSAGGLLIAAGPDLEPRAAALVHHATGPGAGYFAGVDARGMAFVRDLESPDSEPVRWPADTPIPPTGEPVRLTVKLVGLETAAGPRIELVAKQLGTDYPPVRVVTDPLPADRLRGAFGVVSHPGTRRGGAEPGRWAFSDWRVGGAALGATPDDARVGPVLGTKYTLDAAGDGTGLLTLQAQLWPLAWEAPAEGDEDYAMTARLELDRGEGFAEAATAPVTRPDWTAIFRLEDFDAAADVPYRVVYELNNADGPETHAWPGVVRKDPAGGRVVLAAFSCNNNTRGSMDKPTYSFTPDHLWHPHAPIRDAALKADPDVCYFAGDQIYEGGSPTGPDRSGRDPDSYLDYFYKWNMWVWAYRDLAAGRPCAVVPDDHDIFQGNLWGEGGKRAEKGTGDDGGYFLPPEWVNMVQRTQTGNLPPAHAPDIPGTTIDAYYTDMTVGGVNFAVLEDRKFKTGPAGRVPETASGRPDHIIEPDYDKSEFDDPAWRLLGEAQEDYLDGWARDWSGGVWFKCALSQSPFAAVATHHGPQRRYLVADLDANGWPKHARDAAVEAARRGLAVMVHGDQHLPTLIRHGVNDHGDAGWAFTVPGTANFYPRWWDPRQVGDEALTASDDSYTGDFEDGFGNRVTVFAAASPGPSGREPAALHDKKPGWGTVVFERDGELDGKPAGEPTVTFNNFPRGVDPTAENAEQFRGWPRTAARSEMDGREPVRFLPELTFAEPGSAVVTVTREETGEVLYTVRPAGATFRPPVFIDGGEYEVTVDPPGAGEGLSGDAAKR